MGAISGYGGEVRVDQSGENPTPTALLGVRTWEAEEKIDTEDTTAMAAGSDGWKTKQGTLSEWTANIDAYVDSEETKLSGAPPLIKRGQSVYIELHYPHDATTIAYAGDAIVTSVKPKVEVGGLVTFALVVEGTGELTYPNPV